MTTSNDSDFDLDIIYSQALDLAEDAYQAMERYRKRLDKDGKLEGLSDFQRISLRATYREDYPTKEIPNYVTRFKNHLYIEMANGEKCPEHQVIHSHFLVCPTWSEYWKVFCRWGKFYDFTVKNKNK